ncbi:tetratricopeptide repeat protein [Salipaludibacillus sp. CF4.18]|uniref:tetratricopeptide repeat protein n=1 Tax=Salipaludibacillus sp. CF4.18 TaxID=3373081 RepID=UPI003EE5A61B
MKYTNMTLEELEEAESNLEQKGPDEVKDGHFRERINLYEAYYRKAYKKGKISHDLNDMKYTEYVKSKLLTDLIKFGTYMKMSYQKNDIDAYTALKRALSLDRKNPVVNYRLGFIAYKRRDYHDASGFFQSAIDAHSDKNTKTWLLNSQQVYHAHLYLVNSALFIAKQTNERLKKLPEIEYRVLDSYDTSPFYDVINENETYLTNHAFMMRTNEETRYCSKENCDDFYEEGYVENHMILYFSDRSESLSFNGTKEVVLTDFADLLKKFLLHSSSDNPLSLEEIFEVYGISQTEKNTYIQRIRRLRRRLTELGIPEIIITSSKRNVTSYYFDGSVPFTIMQRVGEVTD